jgi:hypothetical protein
VIEQGTSKGDSTQDSERNCSISPSTVCPHKRHSQLEILNPLSILLERHTSGIITQDDDVEQRNLYQIQRDFLGQSPFCGDPVEGARGRYSRGDLFERLRRVEGLKALLGVR